MFNDTCKKKSSITFVRKTSTKLTLMYNNNFNIFKLTIKDYLNNNNIEILSYN